jgi:hypothetical protein
MRELSNNQTMPVTYEATNKVVSGASGWCEVRPIFDIDSVVRYKPTMLITQEKRLIKVIAQTS